jgi:hypothetical protein
VAIRGVVAGMMWATALGACGDGGRNGGERELATLLSEHPQDQFWAAMQQQCGNAYPGRLVLEPPGDDMLTGTEELIVHWRECSDTLLRIPFHIQNETDGSWDRSRTWVFLRHASTLELRHDHRHDDGTPDEQTWYGASTVAGGEAGWQEFIRPDRTAEDGSRVGWRIEIIPAQRYTYGTIRGDEYTWRVDFNLTAPVTAPPAPWGAPALPQ